MAGGDAVEGLGLGPMPPVPDAEASASTSARGASPPPLGDLRHLLRFAGGPVRDDDAGSPASTFSSHPAAPAAPASDAAPVDPGSTTPAHAVGPILAKTHRAPTTDEADATALNLRVAGKWPSVHNHAVSNLYK